MITMSISFISPNTNAEDEDFPPTIKKVEESVANETIIQDVNESNEEEQRE